MATKEYFPGIGKIKFEGKESKNPMAFRYYDAEKVINGKKMKDWLKFAMALSLIHISQTGQPGRRHEAFDTFIVCQTFGFIEWKRTVTHHRHIAFQYVDQLR